MITLLLFIVNVAFSQDLLEDPEVQQLWVDYASKDKVAEVDTGILGRAAWHRSIDTALSWLARPQIRNEQVVLMCEVRAVLDSYFAQMERIGDMNRVRQVSLFLVTKRLEKY